MVLRNTDNFEDFERWGRARRLAKDIVFRHRNGVPKDWVNCTNWQGLDVEVALI